jgi:hypothetical protein
MPSYWRMSPRFWTDPIIRRGSDERRLLAAYLLTCQHRNVMGLYWLPKAYICADLGWDVERLAKPFGELLSAHFIAYDEDAEVVLIRNALKYQAPENDNQVTAALRHIEDLPSTFLASDFRRLAERFCERLAKALPEGFGEPMPDPTAPTTTTAPTTDNTVPDGQAPESAGVVAQARPIDDTTAVFQAWQEAARKPRARLDDKRRRVIKNALRHYPAEDLIDAVRGWRHSPHHCGQNDQRTVYNDLELLLRDSAHIERFRDLERDGPPLTPSKTAAQAMRTSVALRARTQARAQAEEVNHDRGRVGRSGGPAERGLPAPAD